MSLRRLKAIPMSAMTSGRKKWIGKVIKSGKICSLWLFRFFVFLARHKWDTDDHLIIPRQKPGTQWFQDYVDTINRDRSIYGQEVDPLEVRKILGETVTLSKWLLGYDVNMNLWDLQLHGLGSISVEDVRVERNSDLSEVRVGVMVSVENLLLSGQWWTNL